MGQSGCGPAALSLSLSLFLSLPPSFSLSRSLPPRITFPLLSPCMPGVALAPGQLHNSWPCYTAAAASPTGTLFSPRVDANPSPPDLPSPPPPPPSPPGFPGSTVLGRSRSFHVTHAVCSTNACARFNDGGGEGAERGTPG